jgi:signal transduction histidine kinase
MGMPAPHVLVVDDDANVRRAIRSVLCPARQDNPKLDGLIESVLGVAAPSAARAATDATAPPPARVEEFGAGSAAAEWLRRAPPAERPEIAFVDMRMPHDWDGLRTVQELWTISPELQVVLCTAYTDYTWEELIQHLGAHDGLLILKKPFDPIEIQQLTLALSRKHRLARAEAAQRAELERLSGERKLLLESAHDFVYRVRADGHMDLVTPAFERLTGLPASAWDIQYQRGVELGQLPPTPGAAVLVEVQIAGEHARKLEIVEQHTVTSEGEEVRIGVGRDVTERLALEQQLRLLHRLESLGRLAGGVAHDFNNLLTVIGGEAELLELEHPSLDLSNVRSAVAQAADLTRQLLLFTRERSTPPAAATDASAAVNAAARMCRRVIPERIRVEARVAPEPALVACSGTELGRCIMNLVLNAADAIEGSGDVELTTELLSGPAASGPHEVLIRVRDTGSGMPPEVLARVFDPFFTTKDPGRGTGLGLAVVRSVIDAAGGSVQVRSAPGQGTEVELRLPRVGHPVAEPTQAAAARAAGRGERILVVEDDEGVLHLTQRVLTSAGYEVCACASAQAALALSQDQLREMRLVVSDIVMPAMSGPALVDLLRARVPGLRALFVSGHTPGELAPYPIEGPDARLIRKPWTAEALLRELARALGNDAAREK